MALPAAPAHADPTLWSQFQLLVMDGGVRLAIASIILVVGWTAANWARRGLEAALARLPIDLTLKPLIASVVRYAILILTFLLVVQQFGVQTTSLIALLGAAGLAVGLALQGTLSNVASGVMLLVLRPFRVGQFVEVANGRQGTVREIGLFTTLLITRDDVYVSIPNSQIFGTVSLNYTHERMRRVVFTVPVDWVNDVDMVEKTIAQTLIANPLVLKEPAPTAVVLELRDYAVVMRARAHVRSPDYWKALYALQKEVKIALDKARILPASPREAAIIRAEPRMSGNSPPQSHTADDDGAVPGGENAP